MGLNGCLEMYAAVFNTNYAPLTNQRLSSAETLRTDWLQDDATSKDPSYFEAIIKPAGPCGTSLNCAGM
jgi:hypothetical protein